MRKGFLLNTPNSENEKQKRNDFNHKKQKQNELNYENRKETEKEEKEETEEREEKEEKEDTEDREKERENENGKKKYCKDDFEIHMHLGSGNFSEVYLVKLKTDPSKQFALKIYEKEKVNRLNKINEVIMEKHALQKLNTPGHKNIIKLIETFKDKQNVYLLYEYVDEELWNFLKLRYVGINQEIIFFTILQMVRAIEYIHSKRIIHRDIKCENFVINKKGIIKLIDFGTARDLENEHIKPAFTEPIIANMALSKFSLKPKKESKKENMEKKIMTEEKEEERGEEREKGRENVETENVETENHDQQNKNNEHRTNNTIINSSTYKEDDNGSYKTKEEKHSKQTNTCKNNNDHNNADERVYNSSNCSSNSDEKENDVINADGNNTNENLCTNNTNKCNSKQNKNEYKSRLPCRKIFQNYVGTANFMPPEALVNKSYAEAGDLWSLGCTIYQLVTGTVPFDGSTEWFIYNKIKKREIHYPPIISTCPELMDLIEQLINLQPEQRLGYLGGIKQIYEHPYFQKYNVQLFSNFTMPIVSEEEKLLTLLMKKYKEDLHDIRTQRRNNNNMNPNKKQNNNDHDPDKRESLEEKNDITKNEFDDNNNNNSNSNNNNYNNNNNNNDYDLEIKKQALQKYFLNIIQSSQFVKNIEAMEHNTTTYNEKNKQKKLITDTMLFLLEESFKQEKKEIDEANMWINRFKKK